MSELVHLSADADVQTIVDTLTRDGALILDNVVDTDFLAALRAETDPYMEATDNGSDDFAGRQTTRTGGLMIRSEKCRDLIGDPRILTPCQQFLEPIDQFKIASRLVVWSIGMNVRKFRPSYRHHLGRGI